MGKVILGVLIGAAIVVAGLFLLDQPEPTPEERLKSALEDAGDAAKEAANAAADVVGEAGTAISNSASGAVAEMAGHVEKFSEDTKAKFEAELAEWKAIGIITDEGFDFDRATAEIKSSELSVSAQAQINEILKALQAAPDAFEEQLSELMMLLEK